MYVYPRLDEASSLVTLEGIRQAVQKNRGQSEGLRQFIRIDDDRAVPIATGGIPIRASQLESLRASVMERINEQSHGLTLIANRTAFDRELGRALHEHLDIVLSDAAHAEVWNYLSLDVFPDLVVARFPELHRDRFLGSRRNALRRVWERERILGDIQALAASPLGEDELVGLLERTAVARNRALVIALARRVLEYQGPARSSFARKLYFEASIATGPLLLDAMSDSEITEFVDRIQI